MTYKISRRRFIGEASCAAVGTTSVFSTILNMQMANSMAAEFLQTGNDDDYKALVCLFLAGGNDSFNMLVPTESSAYAEYQTIRSDLALASDSLLPLNGAADDGQTFGIHPAMPEMQSLFNNGDLAFVANVGTLVEPTTKAGIESGMAKLPVGLYSHNDQIEHWQTSVPDKRIGFGWGGRTADLLKNLNNNQNISMNISLSGTNTFQAGQSVVDYAIESTGTGSIGISGFDQPIGALDRLKRSAVENMLDLAYKDLFQQTYANTKKMAIENHAQFSGAIGAVQPFTTQFSANQVSQSLQMVAKTIAARKALGFRRQTFFIFFGGWDHHDEVLNNQMAMLSIVSKGMKEFNDALGELGVQNNVTTFTASDFARTLTSNGRGSDHAWGGNHMVMGGAVNGGKVYGQYPALHANNPLDTGRGAIIPTISTDEYFAELAQWFGVGQSELSTVFPNISRFYDTTSTSLPIGFMSPGQGVTPAPTPGEQPSPTPTPGGTPGQLPYKTFIPFAEATRNNKVMFPMGMGAAALGMASLRFRQQRMQEKDTRLENRE